MAMPDDFFSAEPADNFKQEIESWLEGDLAATLRTPPRAPAMPLEDAPAAQLRPASGVAPRREVPPPVRTEWPQSVRSEIYIHRLMRLWLKRGAIASAAFAVVVALMTAYTLASSAMTPGELPQTPDAPAPAVRALVLPDAAADVAPITASAPEPAPAAPAEASAPAAAIASADYLVAVGVFASRERADQLADTLAGAGLPAMQRSLQRGARQLNQIVLGPFLSHAEAAADLQRLRALGGFDDARVVAGGQ
jgi:cell division septation protein DedD